MPDGSSAQDAAVSRDAGTALDAEVSEDAGADAEIPVISCDIELPRACAEPKPTYGDVTPIFEARCVICHNGMAGSNWPLTTYGHVADWQDEIREMVSRCTMPPPEAGIPITDAERDTILMWLRCGLAR
jgi:cytochrome c5